MQPLTGAAELATQIRARADETEQGRRLAPALVESLRGAGLFRMCVPQAVGGLEVEPLALIATIEAIATADGSAGWCVMIGATSGLLAAYLPPDAARTIYGPTTTISGGVFAPLGRATPVDGGYQVSGRWPFASGCQHCDWLMGGCLVWQDGQPLLGANGAPDPHLLLFPAGDAEIIDTWDVSGLRGSGSHDIAVGELFIPAARAVSLVSGRPHHDGLLYRFPIFGLLAIGIAAVALGIARRAIDELAALAIAKTPGGSRRKLSERPMIQVEIARAEAEYRAAHALLFDTTSRAQEAARAGHQLSIADRAALRLAATDATARAAQAVDRMYTAGGGTAVYSRSALQRCFRDVHVATQHLMVAPATYELVGRVLLSLEVDVSQL